MDMYIGQIINPAGGAWRNMHGKIADVRIYNRALTEEEIADSMTKPLTGSEDGLVGYWPLNEGMGNIAYDRTASKNHGYISSNAEWTQLSPDRVMEPSELPLLVRHNVYENPAESVSVLLDVLKNPDKNPLARSEAVRVLGKAGTAVSSDNANILLDILKDIMSDKKG